MNSSTDGIGGSARQRIRDLAEIVEELRQPDHPDIDAIFQRALDRLQTHSAKLSVVGQVKAGKSSIINALTGIGDLLPTEVNPWTAVITNLHFGYPDRPESGALFELFSEVEWQLMVTGDPETRRMAEELLPGFDARVLEAQILEMQQNARTRLGERYRHLLGKQHRFNTVTPEILERYVSAGYKDGEGGPDASGAGQYAGITKSADLFLPRGPFRLPVTLSDTPGINDPFLVRDEITTESFRHADIFVVAISAHQPLNTADMALLKMLSAHSGKRTIVFVNRIDELQEPAKAVPKLLKSLNERLEAEVGDRDIVLLAGSAHWGRIADHGTEDEVAAELDSGAFLSFGAADGDVAPRERLARASGLGALAEALSDAIDEGPITAALAQSVTEVRAAIDLLRPTLQERYEHEASGRMPEDEVGRVVAAERARVLQRASAISQVMSRLTETSLEGMNNVSDSADLALASVDETLQAVVDGFIRDQLGALRGQIAEGTGGGRWTLDTHALRDRVEIEARRSYAACRNDLDRLLGDCAGRLDDIASPVFGEITFDKVIENLPCDEILPAFKPKDSLVEIPLSAGRGWRFWQSRAMSEGDAAGRLAQVIRAEMRPAVEGLVASVRDAVDGRSVAALERLRAVLRAARTIIESEIRTLRDEADRLAQGGDDKALAKIYTERRERAAELEVRLATLNAARERLAPVATAPVGRPAPAAKRRKASARMRA